MRVLVTGGAGFVGSHLALAFKRDHADATVTALDNLKRRGSELALPRLARGGVAFRHGDIRNREDLWDSGPVDLLFECSAEPSVQAGVAGGEEYLLNTNLVGTIHCLDHARRHGAAVFLLSTSRVYPIAALRELPLVSGATRFSIAPERRGLGWSEAGIAETFPLEGSRSLYGASKLCSELLVTEYSALYGLRAVVNRCGVIAGPWQMGKVDQGFVVLWAARHLYGGALAYHGFGGEGRQVRDVLHVDDLYRLLCLQLAELERHNAKTYNVGGGLRSSVSLRELTEACVERAGRRIPIGSSPETDAMDIPLYLSDTGAATAATGWRPKLGIAEILDDIFDWLGRHRRELEPILGGGGSTT